MLLPLRNFRQQEQADCLVAYPAQTEFFQLLFSPFSILPCVLWVSLLFLSAVWQVTVLTFQPFAVYLHQHVY